MFKFDEDTDDDFDFDFDSFDKKFSDTKPDETPKEEPKEAPKPAPAKSKNNKDKKNNAQRNDAPSPAQPRPAGNSTLDVLKQKGYEVITAATVKNSVIDFIGVSDKQINLCLLDKEPGGWPTKNVSTTKNRCGSRKAAIAFRRCAKLTLPARFFPKNWPSPT